MPSRDLPARPNLDHLKNEAKALRDAFVRGDDDALQRVHAVLGPQREPKLTEVQRVIAREYGFPTWAKLRAHVQASRGIPEAVNTFLGAVVNRDRNGALQVLHAEPRIASTSLHVAAVLGNDKDVQRIVTEDPAQVRVRVGEPAADPLLWLCYSPFHGESAERDAGLEASTRALLKAGADPNTFDGRYGVPALYAVTGLNNAPRIARTLLEAGAEVNDGESVFHAAERFHEEALELLLSYNVKLNERGGWGNTPLYFLLRHWDVARMPAVRQGILWLLEHGADPNVRCGKEQENSLHVAARRGQDPDVVRLFIDRVTNIDAQRGDGRTAWNLARRGGYDGLVALLEEFGAAREELSAVDQLMAACGRGDTNAARQLASPEVIASLREADLRVLPEAASEGRDAVVHACLAAGFPVGGKDDGGATALHHAAIHGRAAIVRELLERGADFRLRDSQHDADALGWAVFGVDHVADPNGDYAGTVQALVKVGARLTNEYRPSDPALRALLGLENPT